MQEKRFSDDQIVEISRRRALGPSSVLNRASSSPRTFSANIFHFFDVKSKRAFIEMFHTHLLRRLGDTMSFLRHARSVLPNPGAGFSFSASLVRNLDISNEIIRLICKRAPTYSSCLNSGDDFGKKIR